MVEALLIHEAQRRARQVELAATHPATPRARASEAARKVVDEVLRVGQPALELHLEPLLAQVVGRLDLEQFLQPEHRVVLGEQVTAQHRPARARHGSGSGSGRAAFFGPVFGATVVFARGGRCRDGREWLKQHRPHLQALLKLCDRDAD